MATFLGNAGDFRNAKKYGERITTELRATWNNAKVHNQRGKVYWEVIRPIEDLLKEIDIDLLED